MSRSCQFYAAVCRLVALDASTTLEYILDEALILKRESLLNPCNTRACLIVLDRNDCIYSINGAAAARIGLPLTDLIGYSVWRFVPADIVPFRRNILAIARLYHVSQHYLDTLGPDVFDVLVRPLNTIPDGLLVQAINVTEGAEFRINDGFIEFIGRPRREHTIE